MEGAHDHDHAETDEHGRAQKRVAREQHAHPVAQGVPRAGQKAASGLRARSADACGGRVGSVGGRAADGAEGAGQREGDERCGKRHGGREPQGVHASRCAHEEGGQGRADNDHEGIEGLGETHELLQAAPVALADGRYEGVAGRHAGDVADGAEKAEGHEPAEGEAPHHVDHGKQGHAGRRQNVGDDGDVAAVEAIGERAADKADDELGHGADEREGAGCQGVARGGEQHKRQDDAGHGVAEKRTGAGKQVAGGGLARPVRFAGPTEFRGREGHGGAFLERGIAGSRGQLKL